MQEFAKFILVRGICAVFTYGAYLLALQWWTYEVAYVASYVLGIALAYYSSATFVFGEPLKRRAALLFPLVYVVQFVAGYFLIKVAVEVIHVPEWLALAVSIAVTIPLTFVMTRWVVRSA
ncbi:GtrA family protein [Stenotrophomonas oahuensis]|uniref:GtrA family protein n=1 Tax=Stenotrophomonas oahuensis TaxID=3003271 RepID=A0ABY9YIT3_9GAMM|nr:GtrA family protein [Stenotrophomonas sp. A5586]WNH50787.1 GtrA family protein [Stenotrophomonas sp. A5586]